MAPLLTIFRRQRDGFLNLAHRGRSLSFYVHLKHLTLDDSQNQGGKAIVAASRIVCDRPDQRHVLNFNASPHPVRQHLLGDDLHKLIGVAQQPLTQAGGSAELRAVEYLHRRIDWMTLVLSPPQRYAIEVLEREADGVHHRVTRGAV